MIINTPSGPPYIWLRFHYEAYLVVFLYNSFVKQFAVDRKLVEVNQQNFYTMMMGVWGTTPSFDGNHHQAQHRAGVETTTKHNTELEWKITPHNTQL